MASNVIGVVGLGYVGLPLAIAFADAGFTVIGVESNPERRRMLSKGENYIDPNDTSLISHVVNNRIVVAVKEDIETLDEGSFNCFIKWPPGAIFVCVPTPLTKNKEPDLSYIEKVAVMLRAVLNPEIGDSPILVVLESTSYPGTTEEVLLPSLEEMIAPGLYTRKVGVHFNLAYSPERVDPGNKQYSLKNTPKVVGGVTPKCTERAIEYYKKICNTVIPASSTRAAEMEKLLENTFRSVNIALANEMALLCDRMGLDIWEIIRLAATKPYGFMPFYPGPGVGGHCIPVDPVYLRWKAKEYGFNTRLIELANEINEQMPSHVVSLVQKALNSQYKSLRGSSILILGVAYKPESSDWRVSPALKVMELLEEEGASVYYNDPYVKDVKDYAFIELENIANVDCAVICTDHMAYDRLAMRYLVPLLVNTRGTVSGRGKLAYSL